ncbi:hypothetical protein HMPREF0645_0244 [Hallella bergensis DSM 17361]|uniref:Uncharacterized protein n=1 Tax=Hallella bergensis DSM 17361 TaxID=585502 RepID=D1PTF9_9BACT|nr:hypothetical protein HMPREF0645_0244 [Hallella bergensis DSM 17361]
MKITRTNETCVHFKMERFVHARWVILDKVDLILDSYHEAS